MKVFYPVCSPTDPLSPFFLHCLLSYQTKEFVLHSDIQGLLDLLLLCRSRFLDFAYEDHSVRKAWQSFTICGNKHERPQELSVRDAGLYSHPWSHTVFNGESLSLHPLGGRLGNHWEHLGLAVQRDLSTGAHKSLLWSFWNGCCKLGKWPFALSGMLNTRKGG